GRRAVRRLRVRRPALRLLRRVARRLRRGPGARERARRRLLRPRRAPAPAARAAHATDVPRGRRGPRARGRGVDRAAAGGLRAGRRGVAFTPLARAGTPTVSALHVRPSVLYTWG